MWSFIAPGLFGLSLFCSLAGLAAAQAGSGRMDLDVRPPKEFFKKTITLEIIGTLSKARLFDEAIRPLLPEGADKPVASAKAVLEPLQRVGEHISRRARFELPLNAVAAGEYVARARVRANGETVAESVRQVEVVATGGVHGPAVDTLAGMGAGGDRVDGTAAPPEGGCEVGAGGVRRAHEQHPAERRRVGPGPGVQAASLRGEREVAAAPVAL